MANREAGVEVGALEQIEHQLINDEHLSSSSSAEAAHAAQVPVGVHVLGAPLEEPIDGPEATDTKKRKRNSSPDLDPYTKWALVVRFIQESSRSNKRLRNGSLEQLKEEFGISKRSVQRIYTDYRSQVDAGILVPDMSSKKANRCGAISKLTEEVANNIKALREKLTGKVTARALAEAYERDYGVKLPYMTLYRYDKILSGVIQ